MVGATLNIYPQYIPSNLNISCPTQFYSIAWPISVVSCKRCSHPSDLWIYGSMDLISIYGRTLVLSGHLWSNHTHSGTTQMVEHTSKFEMRALRSTAQIARRAAELIRYPVCGGWRENLGGEPSLSSWSCGTAAAAHAALSESTRL